MLELDLRIVRETLDHIHVGGRECCETAVLWLGCRSSQGPATVKEVFHPRQIADRDFFRIPPDAMRSLITHLRERRLQVLAQVHSHPKHAFHSDADNAWSIVRHVGAYSLVIPWFGARTTAESFTGDIAAFQLDADDIWQRVDPVHILRIS